MQCTTHGFRRPFMLLTFSILAALWASACQPPTSAPDVCQFLGGDFTAPLDAATCTADPETCAKYLNACLAQPNFLADYGQGLWTLQKPNGAVTVASTGASSIRAMASEQGITPMHGRFNTVLMNAKAAEAFNEQISRDPQGHFDHASLPYGSVIAKHNFTTSDAQTAKYEGEPWITVMAKIEGYCAPTVGGNCLGGEWFYYLYRGGEFKQFTGVPVYGKPQAFCTDCHNPVAKADFLWNLHLYVRGRETPYGPDVVPPTPVQPVTPPPSALCAEGALGIGPQPPADVPFDPASLPEADRQAMFDCFSWRTFNALNWPAASGERGVPDTGGSLGDLGAPRVWETFKETAEVFQPDDPTWTLDDKAWNDPQFVPEVCQSEIDGLPEPERAKILRMITKTRAHQVLNETHQAMGNQFNILVDQSGKLIQYEVRLNRDEFEYVKANQMADTGRYSYDGPKDQDVVFPTNLNGYTQLGATEIKASWRDLCTPNSEGVCEGAGDLDSRYYTQIGLVYTPKTRQSEESCRLAKVGLVGLHVIRKTAHAPQWVWSTFEHVDNVPEFGQPGQEGVDYLLYDNACQGQPPTDEFCSLMRPGVIPTVPADNKNCCPNAQLIVNANPGMPGSDGTLMPDDGQGLVKNQITRLVDVGPKAMNSRFQSTLPAPWNNYFLLNTQWPSGARQAEGETDPGSVRRIPCNVVDLLWADGGLFVEKQIPKPSCYTMQPRSGSGELKLRNTTMETFQAAWKGPGTSAASQMSSQSCFNCHGFSGVDFSFLWTDATEEIIPFPPPSSTPPTTGP